VPREEAWGGSANETTYQLATRLTQTPEHVKGLSRVEESANVQFTGIATAKNVTSRHQSEIESTRMRGRESMRRNTGCEQSKRCWAFGNNAGCPRWTRTFDLSSSKIFLGIRQQLPQPFRSPW